MPGGIHLKIKNNLISQRLINWGNSSSTQLIPESAGVTLKITGHLHQSKDLGAREQCKIAGP